MVRHARAILFSFHVLPESEQTVASLFSRIGELDTSILRLSIVI